MGLLLLSMIVFWPIRVLVLSRVFYDGPYSSIFVKNEPRLKKKKKTSVGSAGEKKRRYQNALPSGLQMILS